MKRLWPLALRYWFDALVIAAACGAVLELVFSRGHKEAPSGLLWLLALALFVFPLPLLARRRFPFGAVAAMFVFGAGVSFANGRVVIFATTTS